MELGDRLRQLRNARGLSLRQTVEELERQGVKFQYSYLGMLERGERKNPSMSVLQALANLYEVSLSELLGESYMDIPRALRARWKGLSLQQREQHRHALVSERVRLIIQLLQETARQYADLAVLAHDLAVPEQALLGVLAGAQPSEHLLRQLSDFTGLDDAYWLKGQMGLNEDALQRIASHPRGDDFLDVIVKAIEGNVSPEQLRKVVEAFMTK